VDLVFFSGIALFDEKASDTNNISITRISAIKKFFLRIILLVNKTDRILMFILVFKILLILNPKTEKK